jgi:glycerate dehydrogenase
MNLTILDAFTANPGDLDWKGLEGLASCTFHDRTAQADIIERAQDSEIVLTNKTVLSAATIHALPKLRYIGVLATGYNVVDITAAKEHGIVVANVPGYSTPSVAQLTFALLLELTNHVGHHAKTVREGRWSSCQDFSYWDTPLIELSGRKLGILGFGEIGQAVARIALAMGMEVLAHRRNWPQPPEAGITAVSQEELFAQSDVLTLHCPLTHETKEVINAKNIALMKSSAFLINTARGPLVNEAELAEALNSERIAGACLDVLSTEPPRADNPLISAKNCLITPHIAWATKEARSRLIAVATSNVKAFIQGSAQNMVS